MCLYDLQKAFGSVEFPVLLKRLFDVENMTHTVQLVCKLSNSVCLGQHVSPSFALGHGVRQGSILSPDMPTLFLQLSVVISLLAIFGSL